MGRGGPTPKRSKEQVRGPRYRPQDHQRSPHPRRARRPRPRLPRGWTPNEHLGETLHFITAWTQHELNTIYVRAGGTVTTRLVTRSTSNGDSTWPATEITLTVPVPNIGDVQIVTDWDEDSGGRDLPVMQVIPHAELIA